MKRGKKKRKRRKGVKEGREGGKWKQGGILLCFTTKQLHGEFPLSDLVLPFSERIVQLKHRLIN